MSYRVGVDTGGTFTDFVAVDDLSGNVETLKVASTPVDPSVAVVGGLAELAKRGVEPSTTTFFSHGTTVATNALLEEKGARVGLLVTKGFRGVYEVMDQTRGAGRSVYDLNFTKPRLLAPGRLTGEITERIDARGNVLVRLDEEHTLGVIQDLLNQGVDVIAVCFLFSFLNPQHELRVAELVKRLAPDLRVSLSCEVLPRIREYYRLSTTVVNAFVQPIMASYLSRVAEGLEDQGISTPRRYVMQSSGGVSSFKGAAERPVTSILSGPAAGAVATAQVSKAAGFHHAVGFDMGGTSADIALIVDGRPAETTEGKISGRDLGVPMLDIHTLSAGGGTLAYVDQVGVLQVGPQSAGAEPGPACYARGGVRPTVTDANVVLGLLPGDTQLGGRLALRADLAAKAVQDHIAGPLGIGVQDAAEAILRVVNAKMEAGVRRVSTERGHDLRDFTLVAFGGAGPLHAAAMCRDLGIPRFLVPTYPGLASALGLLLSDVTRDFIRSRISPLAVDSQPEIERIFGEMETEASAVMKQEGYEDWNRERWIELRYGGQGYELPVPCEREEDARKLRLRFDDLHEQRFGHRASQAPVEVVSYRLIARVPVAHSSVVMRPPPSPADPVSRVSVHIPEIGNVSGVPVYERHELARDQVIVGPAILIQSDTTTVIYPGQRSVCDAAGNLIVEVG